MPRALTLADFRTGLLYYALSSGMVLLAVWFGHRFLQHPPHWDDDGKDYIGALCRYDGNWYQSVLTEGYKYDPTVPSNVAFFPAYPLTARAIVRLTGCRPDVATASVSHFFLAATFILLHAYLRIRAERLASTPPATMVLLAFALMPTTFFFRLGYTESMFAFWCVLTLFGYERGWHPIILAIVAGVATATRAPGAALGLVVLLSLWNRTATWGQFVLRALPIGLLCGWGALAFIGYQAYEFGDPLAFAKIQIYWNSYPSQTPNGAFLSLLTLEPIWATYVPSSQRFWTVEDHYGRTPFSLLQANPIYFLLTVFAVLWGWRTKRLNGVEVIASLALILIPYLTRAYPNSMCSFGRFAAAVMPAYIVFGEWLRRLPPTWLGIVCALATVFLFAYSALFGAAWWLI
jgi:hypothetical protein